MLAGQISLCNRNCAVLCCCVAYGNGIAAAVYIAVNSIFDLFCGNSFFCTEFLDSTQLAVSDFEFISRSQNTVNDSAVFECAAGLGQNVLTVGQSFECHCITVRSPCDFGRTILGFVGNRCFYTFILNKLYIFERLIIAVCSGNAQLCTAQLIFAGDIRLRDGDLADIFRVTHRNLSCFAGCRIDIAFGCIGIRLCRDRIILAIFDDLADAIELAVFHDKLILGFNHRIGFFVCCGKRCISAFLEGVCTVGQSFECHCITVRSPCDFGRTILGFVGDIGDTGIFGNVLYKRYIFERLAAVFNNTDAQLCTAQLVFTGDIRLGDGELADIFRVTHRNLAVFAGCRIDIAFGCIRIRLCRDRIILAIFDDLADACKLSAAHHKLILGFNHRIGYSVCCGKRCISAFLEGVCTVGQSFECHCITVRSPCDFGRTILGFVGDIGDTGIFGNVLYKRYIFERLAAVFNNTDGQLCTAQLIFSGDIRLGDGEL